MDTFCLHSRWNYQGAGTTNRIEVQLMAGAAEVAVNLLHPEYWFARVGSHPVFPTLRVRVLYFTLLEVAFFQGSLSRWR